MKLPMRVLTPRKVHSYHAERDGRLMSWHEVAVALRDEAGARAALSSALAESPFAAFFWECQPTSSSAKDAPFGFVVVDSPVLATASPLPFPFAAHLDGPGDVALFGSLGHDALLVAPKIRATEGTYTHLAVFVREGAPDQVDALWRAVAGAVHEWWGRYDAPIWVNTSGLGVSWLHVRLDTRPKYYTHLPFRDAPNQQGLPLGDP